MDVKAMEEAIKQAGVEVDRLNHEIALYRKKEDQEKREAKVLLLEEGAKAMAKMVEQQTKGEYGF